MKNTQPIFTDFVFNRTDAVVIQCQEEACDEYQDLVVRIVGDGTGVIVLGVQGQKMKKDRKFDNPESGEGLISGTFYKDGFNNKKTD